MPLSRNAPRDPCRGVLAALAALLLATTALAAPPRTRKPPASLPQPVAEESAGPAWRVDENSTLDDGPITPTASVANDAGFVFAVYGKPGQFVKFRLEIPAPGLALDAAQPLSVQVDSRLPNPVMVDEAMNQVLRREKLRIDPRWVEWEFGPPYPYTGLALVLYQLRSGKQLHVVLYLADSTTRTIDFSLRGARDRLGVVAPPFDAAYERENKEFEEGVAIERGVLDTLHAAETRCGSRAGDKGPPCALHLRDCVLEYPEARLTPARAKALRACFEAVRP